MSKFRKKPVVIEAMQWDGSRASIEAICRWANDVPISDAQEVVDEEPWIDYTFAAPDDVSNVLCHTLEGPLNVSVGDWIIRGVQGEFYPCKPDIFDATYEADE